MNPSPTDTAAIVAAFHVSAQLAADISRAVGLPGAHSDPANLSRLLAHDFRRKLEEAERALADVLLPVKARDARDLANRDRTLAADVEAWRDSMFESADVSDMHAWDKDGDRMEPGDAWEIVRGNSRFEVREVPRYEVRNGDIVWDNLENDQYDENADARAAVEALNADADPVWIVWDTQNDEDARTSDDGAPAGPLEESGGADYNCTDEQEAREACAAANVEDYRTNAAGWPWANNTGWKIDERDVEDFDAAGFVVARFDGGDLWAGVDGGGYSFTDAHWAPLYLRRAAANGWYVRTDAGLRRVAA
jgi:hypothetical protein